MNCLIDCTIFSNTFETLATGNLDLQDQDLDYSDSKPLYQQFNRMSSFHLSKTQSPPFCIEIKC